MNQPIISVIVPIYNVEPYLRECLDSIIDQTYKHLEIILVDDGSSDRCGDICDEYATKDPRIRVVHQENSGLSAARNAGLDIAKGDYIVFIDSDDWVAKNICETVLSVAEGQQADLVCFGFEKILPSGRTQKWVETSSGEIKKAEAIRQVIMGEGTIRTMSCNKFYSRKLFDGIRFPVGRVHEDTAIIPKIMHRANKIYVIDRVLYYFRQHEGSITTRFLRPKNMMDRLFVYNDQLEFAESYYPELVDYILSRNLKDMLIAREVLKGEPEYADFNKQFCEFVQRYKPRFKAIVGNNRLTQLYYYCRPLAYMYVKWRYHKVKSR